MLSSLLISQLVGAKLTKIRDVESIISSLYVLIIHHCLGFDLIFYFSFFFFSPGIPIFLLFSLKT